MRLFLRPCPFCHAAPKIVRRFVDDPTTLWTVECSSDELSPDGLILCKVQMLQRDYLVDAAAIWNGMERAEYEEMCEELLEPLGFERFKP